MSQVEGKGVAYNAPAAFQLDGPVDADFFSARSKVSSTCTRSSARRYDLIDGEPRQIIDATLGVVELNVVDSPT